jgi:hypothetical protein
VLGSLRNVEKVRIEHIYEYLSILNTLKKIDTDAAIAMMRMYADLAIYNQMISREVNLRINDDSGLLNNPRPFEYVGRLFCKDGEAVMTRINQRSPILNIMTHQILPNIDLAFRSFENRLKVVVMVRHPLYMVDHWVSYIERYGTDPREFSFWLDHGGKAIPWFAHGWEDKYSALNSIDRVILSIQWLIQKGHEAYDRLSDAQKEQVMFIPFERFVMKPWPYVNELENILATSITPATARALKRQKCPRANLSAGRGHKHYGWKSQDKNSDDITDYKRRKEFVESHASAEAIDILQEISTAYEHTYLLFDQSPWNSSGDATH